MTSSTAGRPREFDRNDALRAAVKLFWSQGYAATSLPDLTNSMGIGRSSFYASFGSKHAAFVDALSLYTNELLALMKTAARQDDPLEAIVEILQIVACTVVPDQGCFFVNSVCELLPNDATVKKAVRRHLGNVDRLVRGLLRAAGFTPHEAADRSGALLALATGAVTLRKAGEPAARISAMLRTVTLLLRAGKG